MNKEKVNQAVGELLTKEKYKFIQHFLVGEIIRDFVKEMEKGE